jgi:hypothetical protein
MSGWARHLPPTVQMELQAGACPKALLLVSASGKGRVTRCIEIRMRGGNVSSIIGLPEEWESIKAAAQTVEHLQTLPGWGEFTSVYRVRAANGAARHFIVGEPIDAPR